ncbi:hypothetical protein OC835_006632 [Tilletia horrida]|nr:hypothetical protein OC835_006632 [Tilletia horrida]
MTDNDDLPKKMFALRIEEFQADPPYVLRDDVKIPGPPRPDQVLIEIYSAGYCHTEMVANGDFEHMSRSPLPMIPSHEPTGVVVALGDNAKKLAPGGPSAPNRPLRVGDRVGALLFAHYCGKCDDCEDGRVRFCDNKDMLGVTYDGAFAQYMLADYRSVPLFCAGATIYSAIKACNLERGEHVCIMGAGALGHIGVQLAKALDLKVSTVDTRDPPLELVKGLRLAPDAVANIKDVKASDKERVKKLAEELGGAPDAVIVATDAIPAFELALELVKKHGLMMVVGQPAEPIPVSYLHVIFKGVTVKGSLLADARTCKEMVDLVSQSSPRSRTIEEME